MKRWWQVGLAVAAAALLAGCGGDDGEFVESASTDEQTPVLREYSWSTDDARDATRRPPPELPIFTRPAGDLRRATRRQAGAPPLPGQVPAEGAVPGEEGFAGRQDAWLAPEWADEFPAPAPPVRAGRAVVGDPKPVTQFARPGELPPPNAPLPGMPVVDVPKRDPLPPPPTRAGAEVLPGDPTLRWTKPPGDATTPLGPSVETQPPPP